MKCPRCRQTLHSQNYEGVTIDRCPGCQGAWLDRDEIGRINRTIDEKFDSQLVEQALQSGSTGIPQAEHSSEEICPRCSAKMRPINFNYSSGIIIDSCPHGHGLWFDHLELEKAQIHWEHWEKQREAQGGAWALQAAAIRREAQALNDQLRTEQSSLLGSIGRVIDRALHGIEKARRATRR